MVSWILSTFRPLRPSELCSVSDLYLTEISYNRANPSSKDSNTHLSFFEILRYFGGMLVVVNDEVRFSHEAIRPWLESSKSGWYQPKPEHDRHSDILKACLAHLTYEADLRGDWVMRLPYATEYWVSHCQPKGDAATLAADFFNDEPRLQRWVDAYMALPNLFSKPMDASRIPLALAAHFGLDDILQSLLAKTQGDVEAQGQALIEAARKDQKSCLQILITSRSCNLNFNDTYVQAAMQAACSCGHDDLFKILLDAVLALTPQGHTESRQEEAFGETLREKSPKGDEEVTVGVEKQLKAAEPGAKDSPNEQRPDDAPDRGDPGSSTSQEPMHWLISPLKRASYLGLADIVSKLLFLGADPNGTEEKDLGKRSALHLAVRNPNLETAKLLIDAGANLNAVTNPECFTPLHLATMGGAQVVQLLLGKGSSITAQSRFGLTPLLSASAWGCAPAIEALLQHRNLAEHVPHDTREQPLAMAARGGFYRSVETLLQYRADPNQPDSSGETALQYAVRAGEIDICRLLLQHGADPNFTADEKHSTPLITAVDKQFKDLVQLLVENGAAIETRETRSTLWERTPLLVATCREDPGIVEFLISKGANLEAVDKDGWSAIFASALYGRTESVRILARAGVDVNSYSAETTETPLHVAIKFPETVRVLLQHGANVNLPSLENDEFRTPFDRAVRGNHVETVKIMLEEAQNAPDLTLPSTKKALQNAVTWDYQEVVALVLEAGADVNLVDENGWSLVALAVQHKSPALMRSILEYRPKINTRGPDENTPLHLIVTETPLETVRLLVHAGAQLTATNKYSLTPIINVLTIGHEEAARYLITKSPVFALLKAPPVKDALAPLQAACYSGNLNLVQLLIEKGCDVNSHCGGILATPLMAVASRNTDVQDTERIKVMEYLLDRGADPTIPAGQVAYPISSACWTCSPDIVQILLDRKVSTNVSDSFGRRPIHFTCYNSLAVLDLLGVQDEDFTVEDSTGRLPLHYAVLSGQMALVKEVLLRSERVGIDVNVVDKNNWTPLMWAARASRLFDRTQHEVAQDEDVISFLLEKGADKNMLGNGFNRTWSALQIAQYHQVEKIAKLLGEGLATHEASGPILRGTYGEGRLCDCCFVEIWGLYSECVTCSNYHLCYKCYLAKSIFHSQHEFNDGGSESYSSQEVTEKAVSVKSESAKGGLSDEGETTNQFDDEIVDEENLVHTENTV
ncbi:hypothetical protein CSUB01_02680 [Colletotrichum sublineola]|uniref:ZZ-type domain-containing protein n=1 Tax=Colletotrichum sublineola TaxID=1173701 RepID=A0A066XVS8_COLSU|nr:hypothetical protein CSUB01_02680 [Colletotrichum sublineola]